MSRQNIYTYMNGTSYAAAMVTAQAALIMSINPELTAKQVKSIIEDTSDKILFKDDKKTKYGRINLFNSLSRSLDLLQNNKNT